jgi:membrane protease subunit HflC
MAAKRSPIFILVFLLILLIGIWSSFFIVDETERALILQFGKPVADSVGPGAHFKLPFIQTVKTFDHRVLDYDAQPAEILTKDKKNLVVDNYSRWRIDNPLRFYRTVRSVRQGLSRIDDVVYAELRVALGRYNLTEIVADKRTEIMQEIKVAANESLNEYGINVIDVRIKRTDLPAENQRAIFGRMRAERERQAKQYRSEGQEEAARIRAAADKDKTIMLAEAKRQADVLRGEGDAKATKIYAEALQKDPEFYSFVRSLKAYRKSLKENTKFIFTPESEFFEYLR